jgi:hypothetical protein
MDPDLKEILTMESNKEKECSNGAMEKSMMDNGITEKKMEVACGKVSMEIHI